MVDRSDHNHGDPFSLVGGYLNGARGPKTLELQSWIVWSSSLYKKRVAVVSTMSPPPVDSGGVPSAGNAPAGSRGDDGKCTRGRSPSLLGVVLEAIRRNTIATIVFSYEA